MAYDNTNTGILKINDKGDNDKRPDRKGSIDIEGVEYWLSGWIRDGKAGTALEGQKYLSLKAEKAEKKGAAPIHTQSPKAASTDDFDDDIPF